MININMTKNKVTLLTEGTYCPENIEVNAPVGMEISTEDAFATIYNRNNHGAIFKWTGETGIYLGQNLTKDTYYVIHYHEEQHGQAEVNTFTPVLGDTVLVGNTVDAMLQHLLNQPVDGTLGICMGIPSEQYSASGTYSVAFTTTNGSAAEAIAAYTENQVDLFVSKSTSTATEGGDGSDSSLTYVYEWVHIGAITLPANWIYAPNGDYTGEIAE